MTVGEKIKKYRNLKGWTQKELGGKTEKLKGKTNSGVRINQYEKDMVPGEDMRKSIADALEVDVVALSDVDLRTEEDYMFALFELEEKYGLHVTKEDGKIHLVFDAPDNENHNELLTTYLNFWGNEASKERTSEEEQIKYLFWKARLSSNVKEYLADRETAVNTYYKEKVTYFYEEKKFAKDTTEICRLLKQLVDAGFTLTTRYGEKRSAGYSFNVNELLNPPSEDAENQFARFLSEIKHFQELGADCFTELSLPGDALLITYYVANQELQIIKLQIDKYLKVIKKPNREDWQIQMDNDEFERDIKSNKNNIEDSIKFFAGHE